MRQKYNPARIAIYAINTALALGLAGSCAFSRDNRKLEDKIIQPVTQVERVPSQIKYPLHVASAPAQTETLSRSRPQEQKERLGKSNNEYDKIIIAESNKDEVDAYLIKGQIRQESNFNPKARSKAGAVGLAQFMPKTAKELGYSKSQMLNPEKAIDAQTTYMKKLYGMPYIKKFEGKERDNLALASYNAGYGNVRDAVRIVEAANAGQETYKIVRGKKSRTVGIKGLKGEPETWEGFSEALRLVTGKHAKETINYVEKVTSFARQYSGG